MNRREMLKTTAVVASIPIIGANELSAKMLDSDVPKWDATFDGIIIGSGYAGTTAMLEMLENGMSNILMIDKMQYAGGNSDISGGSMAVANTDMQKKAGLKDKEEWHIKDTLKSGHNLNDPILLKTMIHEGKPTFEWLRKEGVVFKYVKRSGGHSVPRSHVTGIGANILKPLWKQIEKRNGKIQLRTIMDEIIYNKKGEVVGVKVREKYQFKFDLTFDEDNNDSGIVKYYKTISGVIVATGGFGADLKFRMKFNDKLNQYVPMTNHLGATAYTMKRLIKDDIETVDLGYIQLMPITSADERGFGFGYRMITRAYGYGIMVNARTGKRFCNEIADRKVKSDAIFAMNEDGKNPPLVFMDVNGAKSVKIADMQRGIEVGAVMVFDTLDDIVKHFKIPKKAFFEQIKTFNSYIDNNKDPDFGKTFNKIKGKTIKIEKGPFFLARTAPKIHHCMGGVKTNVDCEVYKKGNKIVPGLFAAGEVTGGRHGYNRLGSNAVLDCTVYGKRAGASMAKRFQAKTGGIA